jgi:hypothetical protein
LNVSCERSIGHPCPATLQEACVLISGRFFSPSIISQLPWLHIVGKRLWISSKINFLKKKDWPPTCIWLRERRKSAPTLKGEHMTRFFIDNREIAPPVDVSSMDQVLKQLESAHLPANSVVRKIQIDGHPVVLNDRSHENRDLLDQLEKRNTVEIFTGTLVALANESIAEAFEYLDRIEAATPALAESFRFCPSPESYGSLKQLCEGFYWLNMLLDKLVANFQVQLETVIIGDIAAPQYHQKFIRVLKQLIESQETGDLVLISDQLEYEILPLVSVWRELLVVISKKANAAQ